MSTFVIRRKTYTIYDETDNLKRMKDSDILAEKAKAAPGYGSVVGSTLGGAVVGAGALGAANGFRKMATAGPGFGNKMAGLGKGIKSGGKWGAIAGGLVAGGMALSNRNKQAKENQFYNDRLEYAQRQAQRREKKDWKSNMTQRDGYSY